jgi:zinc transport system permease protein
MLAFLNDLGQHAFLQHALLAALLASVACGVVGTFVVVRRITYIAGGIAHTVLGGMGAAMYLSVHTELHIHPLHGAIVAALAAALIIGLVTMRSNERADTVIGALWAIGMAAGVLFISQTPGYSEDLMSYLFGNILFVSQDDLWYLVTLDAIVLSTSLLLYNRFVAICFDEEFARLRGVRVELVYVLLLFLVALTVVLLTTVVGIILVIALLTLPAATAGRLTQSLWRMMAVACLVSALVSVGGLVVSYEPDLPAGATIIVLAAFVYLVVAVARALQRHWNTSSATVEE